MFLPKIFALFLVMFFLNTSLWGNQEPKANTAVEKPSSQDLINKNNYVKNLTKKLHIPYEKFKLKNGLTVILSPNKNPMVVFNLWYKVGSIHEDPNRTGSAHFFEHLQFEGSAHVKQDQFFNLLQNVGAVGINAYTTYGNTVYYEKVPPEQLPLTYWLESSRMSFPDITQAKIEEQREVVRREREQRYGSSPYGNATLKLWDSIFKKGHPFHGSVIGSHEDLQKATLKDFQSFFDRYYGPTNAVLTLVGGFEVEKTKNLINKYFSTLPRTKPAMEPIFPKVEFKKQEIIRVDEKFGKLTLIRMNYITPKIFAPGDAELDIISDILTGKTGRLTKALKFDENLVNSINSYQRSMKQLSIFSIDALLNSGTKPEQVIAKIDNELKKLGLQPPKPQEIEKSINSLLTKQIFALQQDDGYSGKAATLQIYNNLTGNPGYLPEDVKRYLKITPEIISQTTRLYLPPGSKRKVLIATPITSKIAKTGL